MGKLKKVGEKATGSDHKETWVPCYGNMKVFIQGSEMIWAEVLNFKFRNLVFAALVAWGIH